MIVRTTTTGTLKNYRYNLQRSTYAMNKAMTTVTTRRNFNSFADDPAGAARSFQLRSSYLRTSSQHSLNESIIRKFNVAYSSMDSVEKALDTDGGNSALFADLRALNGADATVRGTLGQQLEDLAKSIVQDMNGRYGDNFVFSGADGLNAPFQLDSATGTLYYRGVDVSATDTDDLAKLDYFHDEKKYVDIGLGYDLTGGTVSQSTVFDSALQGMDFLGGYGVDENGDPNNIVSIITRMSQILKGCDEGGKFKPGEEEEYTRLCGRLEEGSAKVKQKFTELSTQTSFLNNNLEQLKSSANNLNEQIEALDYADEADAISAFIFAKYTYDTALKVGNSVLSQSLMDYLNL